MMGSVEILQLEEILMLDLERNQLYGDHYEDFNRAEKRAILGRFIIATYDLDQNPESAQSYHKDQYKIKKDQDFSKINIQIV
jgi:hypothetical protein